MVKYSDFRLFHAALFVPNPACSRDAEVFDMKWLVHSRENCVGVNNAVKILCT